jgi:predicted extracellular nuclease
VRVVLLLIFCLQALAFSALGQVFYNGGSITQNFNSLPASGSFTLTNPGSADLTAAPISAAGTTGWSISATNATLAPRFRVDAGASSTASHLSSGTGAQTDRALGMLASGSYIGRSTLTLVNQSSGPLTEITVSFTGEQWRNGGSGTPSTLTFAYAIDNGAFVPVSALSFTSPISGTTAAALDGNALANRTVLTSTFNQVPWGPGQTLRLRWSDADDAGSDDVLAIDDFSFSAVQGSLPVITRIHAVQGSGVTSPLAGNSLTVEGVVTGDFQGGDPALGGFYLQELAATQDADPATSEGIYVDDNGSYDVALGDIVKVTGSVVEVSGVTTLTSPTWIVKTGTAPVPSATQITFPPSTTSGFERFEGMQVQIQQTLTVTGVSQLGSEGRLVFSSGGAITTPTNYIDPNDNPPSGNTSTGTSNASAINTQESLDTRRRLILDDASNVAYPDVTPYFNASNTRRCGDTINTLTGFFSYSSGDNKLQPSGAVVFTDTHPRPASPPAVGGRLKVAGMNAHNYFLTLGSRGAGTANELQRQQAKLVAQIVALNADVLGLVEIENTGTTALDTLISAVNTALGSTVYARVPEPSGTGGDLIRVAMIYKPALVTPDAVSYTDSDSVWNRWPLGVAFTELSSGARFLACINHLKAKTGSGATGLDLDQNDGQAAFNERRRLQAARLLTFLTAASTASGTSNILILGDLNANTEEDPIDRLRAGGYTDQVTAYNAGAYSYNFDGTRGLLDHALTSTALNSQVTGAAVWHINADEPEFLDYTTLGKTTYQQTLNVGTPYRASDHDPVLIGLTLTPPPITYATWAAGITWPQGADTSPQGDADGDGMANVLELLLNTSPTEFQPGVQPILTSVSSTQLTLDYRHRQNVSGYTLIPQWSTNLVNWTDLTPGNVLTELSATTVMRRLDFLPNNEPRAFLRLIVR